MGWVLIFSTFQLFSQPFTLEKDLKPVRLQLKESREFEEGKMAVAQGKVSDGGDLFFVKGHGMNDPIDVVLISLEEGKSLKLEVVKHTWKNVAKSAETGGAGFCDAAFRTYGDFGLRVSGPEGTEYYLVVTSGPEARPDLASPFSKASNRKAEKSDDGESKARDGGNATLMYVIAGLLAVIAGLLAVLVLRRKKGGMNMLLLLLLLFAQTPAWSEGRNVPITGFWNNLNVLKEKLKYIDDVNKKLEAIKEHYKKINSFSDLYLGLEPCDFFDEPTEMPMIPSFCAEDEGCEECFREARTEFNEVRYLFGQLRTIYKCTKDFSDKAIAFGDNVSGVHGVSGLAWQSERAKIEKSVKDMESAYDKKYVELLARLQQSLVTMGACEAEYGNENWFDEFGYVFYEFIRESYKRND